MWQQFDADAKLYVNRSAAKDAAGKTARSKTFAATFSAANVIGGDA